MDSDNLSRRFFSKLSAQERIEFISTIMRQRDEAEAQRHNPQNLPLYWARCCTSGYLICDTPHRHEYSERIVCVDCPTCKQGFSLVFYYEFHVKYPDNNCLWRRPGGPYYEPPQSRFLAYYANLPAYNADLPDEATPEPPRPVFNDDPYSRQGSYSRAGLINAQNAFAAANAAQANTRPPRQPRPPIPPRPNRMPRGIIDEPVETPVITKSEVEKECDHKGYSDPDCFYCDKDPLSHL